MKIYTKKGDKGKSNLLSGKGISKTDAVFDALGALDELSASLGIIHTFRTKKVVQTVMEIQNDLFEIGSLISGRKPEKGSEDYWQNKIKALETRINFFDTKNKPLTHFILPGGSKLSSHLHLSRAICRRAERKLATYVKKRNKTQFDIHLIYINRLSDLLFVMARYANQKLGIKDVIWK